MEGYVPRTNGSGSATLTLRVYFLRDVIITFVLLTPDEKTSSDHNSRIFKFLFEGKIF